MKRADTPVPFSVECILLKIWIKAKALKVSGSAFSPNRFNPLLKILISCCAITYLLFAKLKMDRDVNPGVESSSLSWVNLLPECQRLLLPVNL